MCMFVMSRDTYDTLFMMFGAIYKEYTTGIRQVSDRYPTGILQVSDRYPTGTLIYMYLDRI